MIFLRQLDETQLIFIHSARPISYARVLSTAFVLLNVSVGAEKEVIRGLCRIEGVKATYQVYGVYDVVARLEAESTGELKELVQDKIRKIGGVRGSLTMLAV